MVFSRRRSGKYHAERAKYSDKDTVGLVSRIIIKNHSIPPF